MRTYFQVYRDSLWHTSTLDKTEAFRLCDDLKVKGHSADVRVQGVRIADDPINFDSTGKPVERWIVRLASGLRRSQAMIYGWLYRTLTKFAHRYDWHHAKVFGPFEGGRYQIWCQWCGLRENYSYDPRKPIPVLFQRMGMFVNARPNCATQSAVVQSAASSIPIKNMCGHGHRQSDYPDCRLSAHTAPAKLTGIVRAIRNADQRFTTPPQP